MSDHNRISPYSDQYNIKTSGEILENFKKGIISWSITKYSKLTS